ncbi:hypothetical protein BDCR2A_01997 [Borrelia duttonii CR2A]|uniref:Uncharacterized protein n=1 Tax=Borrelia duttonii CR2A TaxID=1432657 RepID=W6TIZ5_9SPIR|nr:hypothetical protein BDCR2A_01997 [Borrelia duttonii CR2A]
MRNQEKVLKRYKDDKSKYRIKKGIEGRDIT